MEAALDEQRASCQLLRGDRRQIIVGRDQLADGDQLAFPFVSKRRQQQPWYVVAQPLIEKMGWHPKAPAGSDDFVRRQSPAIQAAKGRYRLLVQRRSVDQHQIGAGELRLYGHHRLTAVTVIRGFVHAT